MQKSIHVFQVSKLCSSVSKFKFTIKCLPKPKQKNGYNDIAHAFTFEQTYVNKNKANPEFSSEVAHIYPLLVTRQGFI